MKYRLSNNGMEFSSLEEAKAFITKNYSEFVLVNDDMEDPQKNYCRYSWGGYHEGIEIFITRCSVGE